MFLNHGKMHRPMASLIILSSSLSLFIASTTKSNILTNELSFTSKSWQLIPCAGIIESPRHHSLSSCGILCSNVGPDSCSGFYIDQTIHTCRLCRPGSYDTNPKASDLASTFFMAHNYRDRVTDPLTRDNVTLSDGFRPGMLTLVKLTSTIYPPDLSLFLQTEGCFPRTAGCTIEYKIYVRNSSSNTAEFRVASWTSGSWTGTPVAVDIPSHVRAGQPMEFLLLTDDTQWVVFLDGTLLYTYPRSGESLERLEEIRFFNSISDIEVVTYIKNIYD